MAITHRRTGDQPITLTLSKLKEMPRKEVAFTVECSGNNGLPFFQSGVGNARWAGTSLADVLKAAKIKDGALEVVFFGADHGKEVVHQATPMEYQFTANFARSMSIADAMSPSSMLCCEMNGEPLSTDHGSPCRLIAPGWFGIANVKWLSRIEVINHRFVGRQLIKSAPARVVEHKDHYQIQGMAWGPKAIAAVAVKIDNSNWIKVTLAPSKSRYEWQAWRLDWSPTPGAHSITSRATDIGGAVQPAMDDPVITGKKTHRESNGQITRHVQIS